MLNQLIRWSLSNRAAVVALSGVLLVAGVLAGRTMPIDVFPDLTAPTVTVLVEAESMAPEELETLVTFPIETTLNGAADVRRVRSATAVGIAVIWVEFEWGTEIHVARQTVSERLASVAGSLPPEVEPPVLAPTSSIMGEIMFISLTSESHSPMELRTTAMTDVRRRLLAVGGVSQVVAIGGDEKQYQVIVSPSRLRAYDLSLEAIVAALKSSNESVSAGLLTESSRESVVQGLGRFRDADDIADSVVAVRNGRPVTVSDFGVVRIGAAIRRGTASSSRRDETGAALSEDGVVLAIQKQPGANTLELTRRIDAALDQIADSLPTGMLIHRDLFRQAAFIDAAVSNTLEAVRDGAVIVIVVVVVFLASVRASLITLLAMPLSLVVAVLTLRALGSGINTMTLGGMAIAIGMLVDDAIIDVENVVRRLRINLDLPVEKRISALEVIFQASVEVRSSIVFATWVILLVFCPIYFLGGVEGRLLKPLGLAFMISLAASLLVALTLTPVLCYYLLAGSAAVRQSEEPRFLILLNRMYGKPLEAVLKRPVAALVATAAMLVAAVFGLAGFGIDFLPPFNEGALVVGTVTMPGTSLDESNRLAAIVQDTLMRQPEVVAIGRRTGRAELDEHVQGVEASEIDLTLDMDAAERMGRPRRSREELLDAIRRDLALVPGIRATVGQPISHRIDHMLSGTRASIAVKVFGEDLRRLRQIAGAVQSIMANVEGIVDLSTEQQSEVATVRFGFDREAMSRHEIRPEAAAESLRAAFRGCDAGQLFEGRIAYDCVVKLGDWKGWPADQLGQIPLKSPKGYFVPMQSIARIEEDVAPNFIGRENAQRKIVVMCNVAGRDIGGVVEEVRRRIHKEITLPQGYHIEYGGQFESALETRKTLMLLAVLIVGGIGFLLHTAFRSAVDALFIMLNVPLALIGGVAGVQLSGGTLTVASLIGFISVFGISARNGIMLVSHVRFLQRHEGVTDFLEAIRRGSRERLVPILMTALSSGLGLFPLVLGGGEPGKEILTPMALVILWGLLSATLLNLFVIPALFGRFGRRVPPPEPDGAFPQLGRTVPGGSH